MTPIKPGILTSEFLTMFIAQIVNILVLSGRLDQSSAAPVTDFLTATGKVLIDLFSISYALYTAYGYIKGRNELKKALIDQNKPAPQNVTVAENNTTVAQ